MDSDESVARVFASGPGQPAGGVRIAAMSNCRRTFSLTMAPPSASLLL